MTRKEDAIFSAFLKLMEKQGLKHVDIKTDCDEDVEAITFSNNELYIKRIQEIEIE